MIYSKTVLILGGKMEFVFNDNEKEYFSKATSHEKQNALVHAFLARNWEAFDWILAQGMDLNKITYEILWDAVLRQDINAVKKLIASGVDVNRVDGIAFREAIRLGNLEIADVLVSAGADPKVVNNQAMSLAAEVGNLAAVKKLIALKVPAKGWNYDPLVRAAENNHVGVMEYLLGCLKGDFDSIDPLKLPMRAAIKNNSNDIGKLIIKSLDKDKMMELLESLEERSGFLPDDWAQRVEHWRLMVSMEH